MCVCRIVPVCVRAHLVRVLPPRGKVRRPWPGSYVQSASAPGSTRWRSRCSGRVETSCCRCTEGSLCRVSSPAHPPATPPPRSTYASGPRYSTDKFIRVLMNDFFLALQLRILKWRFIFIYTQTTGGPDLNRLVSRIGLEFDMWSSA